MIEDEELQDPTEPWPNEAQKAEAIAAFEAFEEELWREREDDDPRVNRATSSAPPPWSRSS